MWFFLSISDRAEKNASSGCSCDHQQQHQSDESRCLLAMAWMRLFTTVPILPVN